MRAHVFMCFDLLESVSLPYTCALNSTTTHLGRTHAPSDTARDKWHSCSSHTHDNWVTNTRSHTTGLGLMVVKSLDWRTASARWWDHAPPTDATMPCRGACPLVAIHHITATKRISRIRCNQIMECEHTCSCASIYWNQPVSH